MTHSKKLTIVSESEFLYLGSQVSEFKLAIAHPHPKRMVLLPLTNTLSSTIS